MPEIGRSCFAAEAARGVIPDFGPKSELPESQECAEAIFVRFEVNRGCLNRLSENKFSITPVFSYICPQQAVMKIISRKFSYFIQLMNQCCFSFIFFGYFIRRQFHMPHFG